MPKGEWSRPRPSKYQPLLDLLAAPSEDLTLTIAEITTIIGGQLAMVAYTNPEYWRGARFVHLRRWQALGWHAQLNTRTQCVHFTRDVDEG